MQAQRLRRERVYAPVLRLIHAWNALLVVQLLITSQLASWLKFSWEVAALWRLHLWCGYLLLIGLFARLVWGFVGPAHARLTELWQPGVWLQAIRKRQLFPPPEAMGHHPLGSLASLAFYAMAWIMAGTGLALVAIDQGVGPLINTLGYAFGSKNWFRLPHDRLAEFPIAFVVPHLAALILHERLQHIHRAGHGKRLPISKGRTIKIRHFLMLLLASSPSWANSPQQILGGLEQEARRVQPGFTASAKRGELFYRVKHTGGKEADSCVSCHTENPKAEGKHIKTHKAIEPLAPSVNKQRFTDPAHVEVWFRCNCREALGGVCTPQEKTDFTANVFSVK